MNQNGALAFSVQRLPGPRPLEELPEEFPDELPEEGRPELEDGGGAEGAGGVERASETRAGGG